MEEYRLYVPDALNTEISENGYGIALYKGDECSLIIEDISNDKKKIEKLIDLFNSEGLDTVHFSQAVEDFLQDQEI